MKAQVITQHVYEGTMDFLHSGGFTQTRLLIPDAKHLVVWTHQGNVCVHSTFDPGQQEYQVVREIEVSDKFVRMVLAFVQARETLCQTVQQFLADPPPDSGVLFIPESPTPSGDEQPMDFNGSIPPD